MYKYEDYNIHVCIYVLNTYTRCREKQIDRRTDRDGYLPQQLTVLTFGVWIGGGSFTSYCILFFEFNTKAYIDFVIKKSHKNFREYYVDTA